jgi:3-oxoacyl-ACP reductase-like protein
VAQLTQRAAAAAAAAAAVAAAAAAAAARRDVCHEHRWIGSNFIMSIPTVKK